MIVALDLETTGLDSSSDRIIEVALIKFDSNSFEVVDKYVSLVNPEIEIPDISSNITGIFNEDVVNAPLFRDIAGDIEDFIGDLPILGHNVYFDKDFLVKNDIDIVENITIDTFLFSNTLFRSEKSLSLESLSNTYNLGLDGAHRAFNDTLATIKLFQLLVENTYSLSEKNKEIFKYILTKSEDSGFRYILDNFVDKKIKKIDKTILYKNLLSNFSSEKEYGELIEDSSIEIKDLNSIINNTKNLELRENQEEMSSLVKQSLLENKKLVIEAPTGVGKTFAYLLPSILYSIKNGEQVYISTSTKALQDQIFFKDIKSLSEILDYNFTYSKLKGKKNYLGIYSFFRFFDLDETLDKEKTSFFLKIIFWIFESEYYELDELDYYGKEYGFLREINADDRATFSSNNIYEIREPAVRARRKARETNIVIINNNLLFQDIDGDNNLLGKVKNLVLDESHNLEDVITSSLRKGFTLKDVEKTFSIVDNILKKHKYSVDNFLEKTESILFELGALFDILSAYLNKKVSYDSNYKNALIQKDFYNNDVDNIDISTLSLSLKEKFIDLKDALGISPDDVFLQLNKELVFIDIILEVLGVALNESHMEKYISIISYSDQNGLSLEYTLLKPGNYLSEKLWSKVDTCILTSATLRVNDSFDYIKNILGLDSFDFKFLDTDFDYSKQALLYVPDDLGSIKNNLSNIINFLLELLKIIKGNTLVLFTAFFTIREVYSSLNTALKKENINIYAQGIGGGKHKLLDFFKKNSNNSVLLGTDTFWEGIDIPGEKLKYLVIYKVPFMVPSDPIFQARSTIFQNAFLDYSIPKAIIKLKQGFGRLIRTKKDNGIIIFLDDRIYSTDWGSTLFSAFPKDINYKKGTSTDLLKVLKK